MADTTPLAPTDAEIAALRSEFGITSNGRGIKEFTQVRDFARAVLARRGQPAHSGEPVATVIKRGASRDWMSERLGGLPDGVYSLYLNPQPVEREPLTDEQIESAAKVLAASFDYPWDHMPEKGRETMRGHVRSVIAATAKP